MHTQMNEKLAAKYRRKYGREPTPDTDEFWDFIVDEMFDRAVMRGLSVSQYIENHVIKSDPEIRKLVNRVFWHAQVMKSLRRRVSYWH
jgi:hypothetical protein